MDWNNSPVVKRWIVIVAAVLLTLTFIACLSRNGAGADAPPTYSPPSPTPFFGQASPVAEIMTATSVTTPAPVTFTAQAKAVTGAQTLAASGGNACHSWRWVQDWPQQDAFHNQAMDSQVDFQWGVGCKYAKITTVEHYYCADLGGSWDYNGCDKSRGATGYFTMTGSVDYHYTFYIVGVTFHATPHLSFTVQADGRVYGTFYYDN